MRSCKKSIYVFLPRCRTFTSPTHTQAQPLSLPPAHKKSILSQELTVTPRPSMYLRCALYAAQSGMESPKDFETRLAMPAAVGRERRAATCAMGKQTSPQHQPHIPLSAPEVASTELCRTKIRTSSWSLTAAQALQLLSPPVCSPLCLQLQCCCTIKFISLANKPWFLPTAGILSEASP